MFKTISSLLSTFFFFAVIIAVVVISSLWEIASVLPDYRQLAKYEPAVTTRLFAGDGQLLKEYASEKRLFVPVDKIPDKVKNAFIAAEDKNFRTHFGVDLIGIAKAMVGNVKKVATGRRPAGASTITQQVAKNFLLSSELSYKRKIKEAILATRIEQTFSKDDILELYLNEIYLGKRSYGVAAAALNYFGKSLDELQVEEVAFLAALPKGPNNYNPTKKYAQAIARRNWVIGRMLEEGYIAQEEADIAIAKPLVTVDRNNEFVKYSDYFSEEVRRIVNKSFGEDALYEGGLIIRTTLDPKLQKIATQSFQKGLESYDSRHGYRGPVANIALDKNWKESFAKVAKPKATKASWTKAVVLNVKTNMAVIETEDGSKGEVLLSNLGWARKTLKNQGISNAPTSVANVLKKGDVVLVEKQNVTSYLLRQIPNIEGAMIAINPHTGKVLSMVGGYDFDKSQFNRATQALRQTGSAFKPIVYLSALEKGYSPTDIILDAPFVLDQGAGLPKWKPKNYSPRFYGLTTLRQGVEKSRNLMTVRLAQAIGMETVAEYSKKLGVNDHLPTFLSMSLGAGDSRLIDMAMAYSMFVNGGKKTEPYFIERIQDRNGKTIFRQDERECLDCKFDIWNNQSVPVLADNREQVIDPISAYQMVSILEGVVKRGTGGRLRSLHKNLAGKTGTTNKSQDGWFVGFSSDLVVAIYVGFDEPRNMGRRETGASAALPIFYDFMYGALKNKSDTPFRTPKGVKLVRINYNTGKPATPQDMSVIVEVLKPEYDFDKNKQKIIGNDAPKPAEGEAPKQPVFEKSESGLQLGNQY